MTTKLTFLRGTEPTIIEIVGRELYFIQNVRGIPTKTKLEGLQFLPSEIVKEFPDLEGKSLEFMKAEAVRRLKKHIQSMKTEGDVINYLKEDLAKHGYKLKLIMRNGFRPEVL